MNSAKGDGFDLNSRASHWAAHRGVVAPLLGEHDLKRG